MLTTSRLVRIPVALLEDEALGRKVWEEMEAKLVKLPVAETTNASV